jgi:hypothetical protein
MAMLVEAGSRDDGHFVVVPKFGLEALSHPIPPRLAQTGSNRVYFGGIQFSIDGANPDYFGAGWIRVKDRSVRMRVERGSKERREQYCESFHRKAMCKRSTQNPRNGTRQKTAQRSSAGLRINNIARMEYFPTGMLRLGR